MTVYNVLAAVVELVEADSPADARQQVAAALRGAGFEPYDGDLEQGIAIVFESDDQSPPAPLPGTGRQLPR